MINRQMALAALFVEQELEKEAALSLKDVARGAKKLLKGGWGGVTGAARGAGVGAEKAIATQGHPYLGKVVGGGIALLPAAALTYGGYRALKPEVESVSRRASGAVRSKLQQFEQRSYGSSPYYTGGRYV